MAPVESIRVRDLHGKFRTEGSELVLEFRLRVPDDEYLDVEYTVRKAADGSLEGKYAGEWRFVEKTTDLRVAGHPFELRNGEEAYPVEVTKTVPRSGDEMPHPATITLTRAA